jgi:hypothetical protein
VLEEKSGTRTSPASSSSAAQTRGQAAEDGRRAADFAAAQGHDEILALLGKGEVG